MKKIENVGNLPKPLQVFARALGGIMSSTELTEFNEMESIKEFELKAVDIGYEITPPAIDASTGRGFLVGFSAEKPKHIETLNSYAKLKIYFVEASEDAIKEWTKKISAHREMQQEDMRLRQGKIKKPRKPFEIVGV